MQWTTTTITAQLWGGNRDLMSVRVKLSVAKKDKTLSLKKITGEQVFRLQHKETKKF